MVRFYASRPPPRTLWERVCRAAKGAMGIDDTQEVNVTGRSRWDQFFFISTASREAAVLHGAMTGRNRRPTPYLRPYELADAIMGDRRRMLQQCLVATHCGLLQAMWCICCPRCDHIICCVDLRPSDRLRCLLCRHEFARNRAAGLELVFVQDPHVGGVTRSWSPASDSTTYLRVPAGGCAIVPLPLLPQRLAVWHKRRLWALVDLQMDDEAAGEWEGSERQKAAAVRPTAEPQVLAVAAAGMLRVHGAAQHESVVGVGPVPRRLQAVRVEDAMDESGYRVLRAQHFGGVRQGAVGA